MLTHPAALLVALLVVQVTLGALNVLSQLDVWINSVHLVCGALVLATSLVLTLRSWRVRFSSVDIPIAAPAATHTMASTAPSGARA